MNRVVPPAGPQGDTLDALLTAFYRKEMPALWPAFQPLASRSASAPARQPERPADREGAPGLPRRFSSGLRSRLSCWARPALRSRLALAASLALLVLGAALLPRSLPGTSGGGAGLGIDTKNGEASRAPLLPGLGSPPSGGTKPEMELPSPGGSEHLELGPDGLGIKVYVSPRPKDKGR
jgi:hypothetical protein